MISSVRLALRLLPVSAVLMLVAVACPSSADRAATTTPFAPDSPFNKAIPIDAPVDPKSGSIVDAITREGVHAGLIEFGIPIYDASPSTPRYIITCREHASWGPCPLEGVSVPIPDEARPQSGSDGAMVVADWGNDRAYEFWRATKSGSMWSTTWGSVSRLSGDGWSSTATGSGASRLGGVIRESEVAAGVIPHALVLQSSHTCRDVFRFPATKTDGASTESGCIPEGSQLQLDPTLDVTNNKNLTKAERAIFVALQKYGAFVIDKGGAMLSMSFERAADATSTSPGAQYKAAGLYRDYELLNGIPWSSLRLLAAPNEG